MKILLAALLLLPAALLHSQDMITIGANVVEAPATVEPSTDIAKLHNTAGVDMITSPALTCKSGASVVIKPAKDFAVPGRDPVRIGQQLKITPVLEGKDVRFTVDMEDTRFEGFYTGPYADARKSPVFSTIRTLGLTGRTPLAKPVLLLFPQARHRGTADKTVFAILTFVPAKKSTP